MASEPAVARPSFDTAGLEVVADSLDDGPHIYWQSDSAAIAFYLCDGSVAKQTFLVSDTLRFHGFCGDSLTEYVVAARTPEIQPSIYEDVPKIFVVSDIHGEYAAFVDLLVSAGIVDQDLHWRWGTGHLVVDGDVFDRGDLVTESLWLIYRLEREAIRAGGRVHFVLGNHEIMAMQGDLRYVNKKYMDGIVRRTKIMYQDLYGPHMEMGRWLRTKHSAIRLNGILFVHGGIGPHIVERGLGLEEINAQAREHIDLRSYQIAFDEVPIFWYSSGGPFWYRGYYEPKEGWYMHATPEEVEAILDYYGAHAVVVGHTGVEQVKSLYDGRVFGIDIPLNTLGSFQGLLWEGGVFHRVTGGGELEELAGHL
ncbi:MAG: metallophosphoesterase [Gemmatimonadetes bacterium]|nr:metallophosphoesterase [Gemmatimonadota bacterium]NIO31999.1 metallophosphoesterase [Gemmatimonadota bacterium]